MESRFDKHSVKDNEMAVFLKGNFPTANVVAILQRQGKSEKEIDAFVEKYEASKKKISKFIPQFIRKVEEKYQGQADSPQIVNLAIKEANKYGLAEAELNAIKNMIVKGNLETNYEQYHEEVRYSPMTKTLGLYTGIQTINPSASDMQYLDQISKLCEATKQLHSYVRDNVLTYTDCAPEAITGKFDPQKQNVHSYIHPLIAAMFLPKIDALERRMLYTNIGRYIVQRSSPFLDMNKNFKPVYLNMNNLLPGELTADVDFMIDVARDPNNMSYFGDDSPMSNLLKRYTIQIELWKNVLALRQGKFYDRDDIKDDTISGLNKALSTYEWVYHDSPDLYAMNDEGSMLRKMLAVFSIRPTVTQTQNVNQRIAGISNMGFITRPKYETLTVCNVRLPTNLSGQGSGAVRLTSALTSDDWFFEQNSLVLKNKSVIHSNKLMFFYVNRRQQSANWAVHSAAQSARGQSGARDCNDDVNMYFQYLVFPGTVPTLSRINTTEVAFDLTLQVQAQRFKLVSTLVLNPLMNGQVAAGCSAIIRHEEPSEGNRPYYWYYNPTGTASMIKFGNQYVRNDPCSVIPEYSNTPNTIGFYNTARKYGTVFMYVAV